MCPVFEIVGKISVHTKKAFIKSMYIILQTYVPRQKLFFWTCQTMSSLCVSLCVCVCVGVHAFLDQWKCDSKWLAWVSITKGHKHQLYICRRCTCCDNRICTCYLLPYCVCTVDIVTVQVLYLCLYKPTTLYLTVCK